MVFRLAIYAAIIMSIFPSVSAAGAKSNACLKPLGDTVEIIRLNEFEHLTTAADCAVLHNQEMVWLISDWVIGAELYKSYQNPSLTCSDPYPFTVEEVSIVLYFYQACNIYVSVDVESVDNSIAGCPVPGSMLSISSQYTVTIPDADLYEIVIPLDEPVSVNGPYFVGFYLDLEDSYTYIDLVTDSVPVGCTTFNIWDETIGYIDLTDNDYYNFPGRIFLFSYGTTGGGGGTDPGGDTTEPEPATILLKPLHNELLLGQARLWASETSGSSIVSYTAFDYRSQSGGWNLIGYDFDDTRMIRNGVNSAGTGDGYSILWDYTAMPENKYWLRARVLDTLGRSDVDSHLVTVDPTPPVVLLTGLTYGQAFCTPLAISTQTQDENIDSVVFETRSGEFDCEIPVVLLDQDDFGDGSGQYYCGPVAAATAVQYFFDQGYTYLMREGTSILNIDTVVERLAEAMRTIEYDGTYDDLFYLGLSQYVLTHGGELKIDIARNPQSAAIRNHFQEQESFVVLALSGTPGLYVTLAGISGLADLSGRYTVKITNPISGQLLSTYMQNGSSTAQLYYSNGWHDIDLMFIIRGYNQTTRRERLGTDKVGSNGWSYVWDSYSLNNDSLYYLSATAYDRTGLSSTTTILLQYDCNYVKGDYDGDGTVDIGDALYLTDYLFKDGLPPVGGEGRADANGDGYIDIADAIYIIKYVYGTIAEPRY